METENKIVAWFLLALGVGIIIFTLFLSFQIFSGQKPVPEVFKFENASVDQEPTEQVGDGITDQISKMAESLVQKQLQSLLPVNPLPTLLNLVTWSIFASIMIFGGSQIAKLGIRLLKP